MSAQAWDDPAGRIRELEAELHRREAAEAQERARIVWWLRMAIAGPAAVNETADYLRACEDLADVIEQHPERFAQAPVGASS